MNKIVKLAVGSMLSICAATMGSAAMADERDGTIERFTCLDTGVPAGHLQSTYVKLIGPNQGKKYGFGGGDTAISLSNDGYSGGTFYTGTGSAANFIPQKKSPGPRFSIYFKPVGVNISNVRVYVCLRRLDGRNDYLLGTLGSFHPAQIKDGNGWYVASEDLDSFNGNFKGANIERISVVLNARGDDGYILVGNTQVYGRKDLLDPSTLVMDEVPCTSSLTCGALVQN
ncbi:MAG: hypothetical protein EKK48_09205 [Candidatus Melainabacteria bacterium]|nr:MAG: hypothetical protein EKK48_09205 [Candidatus Melainabacteria bacterium]